MDLYCMREADAVACPSADSMTCGADKAFSPFYSAGCEAWCGNLDGAFHKCYSEDQCKNYKGWSYCWDTLWTSLFELHTLLYLYPVDCLHLQTSQRIVHGLMCDTELCVCALVSSVPRWLLWLSKKRWGWLFVLAISIVQSKSLGPSVGGSLCHACV